MILHRLLSAITRQERNKLNENFDRIERTYKGVIDTSNEAKDKSTTALKVANSIDGKATEALEKSKNAVDTSDQSNRIATQAKTTAEATAKQLTDIILESGTSDAELIAMRTSSEKGITFMTAGARVDLIEMQMNDIEMNINAFGIYGDGVNDVTVALQDLALELTNKRVTKLVFNPHETYVISDVVRWFLPYTKHLELDFRGATVKLNRSFRYFDEGLFTLEFVRSNHATIIIKNVNFDGSGNPPSFLPTDINPNGGRGAFFVNGAAVVKMDNCHFTDLFYSACLWTHYATLTHVTNCTGVRVGGRSANNAEDARGDVIYAARCGDIDINNPVESSLIVENCDFASWDAVDHVDGAALNSCQSGRCGVVMGEFARNDKPKNLIIKNTRFYNYQRVIHAEGTTNINILCDNCNFDEFGTLLLIHKNSNVESFSFKNCTITRSKKVKAMATQYESLVASGTDESRISGEFTACTINLPRSTYLVVHGSQIDLDFKNVRLTTNTLLITHTSINMIDSVIKYNSSLLTIAAINFYNCDVMGGYLKNGDSRSFLYSEGALNGQFDFINSRFRNVAILYPATSILNIDSCEFEIDDDFVGVTAALSRNCLIAEFGNDLSKMTNSMVTNNKNTAFNVFDTGNGMTLDKHLAIENNNFKNVVLSIFNSTNHKANVDNNRFYNTGALDTRAFVDGYGSAIVLTNNKFYGKTSGEIVNVGASSVKLNNYRLNDGLATPI